MAEAESKSSRFKSKWGKILKPKDGDAPTAKGNLTFSEDVASFLQPSIEAAAANKPKLDVSIAQRWPEANEVRLASGEDGNINGWRKRRRREGLKVGFARTAPEVIGEGGDEAPDPVSEVSRNKARNSRSVSDVRPGGWEQGMDTNRGMGMTAEPEQGSRPPLAQRAQTSAYEVSPAVQKRQESLRQQEPPPRLGISRTPTGFASLDEPETPISPYDDDVPPLPNFPTSIDETFAEPPQSKSLLSAAPQDPHSFAARKQHDMRANEGLALRRASAMIEQGVDLETESAENIVSPLSSLQSAISSSGRSPFDDPRYNTGRNQGVAPVLEPPEPQSAISPDGPSPFADPKYVGRHSRETSQDMAYRPPEPQQRRVMEQPSYMRAANKSALQPSYMNAPQLPLLDYQKPPPEVAQQPRERSGRTYDPSGYIQAEHRTSPERSTAMPIRQPQSSTRHMDIPQDASRSASRSPMRERIFDSRAATQIPLLNDRANGSSTSVNRFAPSSRADSPTSSRDENSPKAYQNSSFAAQSAFNTPSANSSLGAGYGARSQTSLLHGRFGVPSPPSPLGPTMNIQSPTSPHHHQYSQSPDSPPSSRLGQPGPSPYARGPSPNDYFTAPRQNPTFPATPSRSPAAMRRQEETSRSPSAQSDHSGNRPAPSPLPPAAGNPAADVALADFAGRVAHMKGVFRLTAEKERPADRCLPQDWLRSGLWWYLRGKSGLEVLLQQRARSQDPQPRELLMQAHVDLAKAWWIVSDPLDRYEGVENSSAQSGRSRHGSDGLMQHGCVVIRSHLKSLSYSMARSNVMPPPQSLIQGQDTQIWLDYPRFTPDAAAVLGGAGEQRALIACDTTQSMSPLDALPLGDTRDYHCYGRFLVDASLNTDDGETDRVSLPSVLTITRGRKDFQSSVTVASQSDLVNLTVSPSYSNTGNLTWHEVSWKASSHAIVLRLPRGFDLTIRMQERDFRQVWNIVEYTRKVDRSMRPQRYETLVHEGRVVEVQYADSSNPNAFPSDKVKGCLVMVWEKHAEETDGSTIRKMHRGFRLLVVTDPGHKTLSNFSHHVCGTTPLMFEFITDTTARGTTALVIRTREERRQCRMLLVFPDMESRQELYDLLNGLDVKEDESIVGKTTLTGLDIQAASNVDDQANTSNSVLSSLQWQKLGITNGEPHDPNSRLSNTVESENLRIIARHTHGCITDRLNLGKGELRLRFPCVQTPTVQLLRQPQEDLTISVETRTAPPQTSEALVAALHLAQTQPTIRTFTFASPADLHAFQAAITGFTVRYDSIAASLGISRRRMVVPVYHKLTASNVRLQIVANPQNTVIQLLAFMEDFSHADALCFQIKSTDVYETIKGDAKGKKWAVKMVDAKFSLPAAPGKEKGEVDEWDRIKRRFVNLEGLEYQEEHDDITVGFDSEEARDMFAQALPAATTVGRMITLKRRI